MPRFSHISQCALVLTASCGLSFRATAQFDRLWIDWFGTGENESMTALTPDEAGGVFAAGYTRGDLGGKNAGGKDMFLARYYVNGQQEWVSQVGTSDHDWGSAVAPDGAGGAFLGGFTHQTKDEAHDFSDLYMARFNSHGHLAWTLQWGTDRSDQLNAMASDTKGGFFVGGETDGDLASPNAGLSDAFIARCDGDGNRLWIRQFGTSSRDSVSSLLPDGIGGVFAAGSTKGAVGGPNTGLADAYIARYDADGNRLWITLFGTPQGDVASALASDGEGGVLVAGRTSGDFGGPNAGSDDIFLAKFDGDGHQIWAAQFGSSGIEMEPSVAEDGAGGAFVAGRTRGVLVCRQGGDDDAFLAHISAAGDVTDLEQLGTPDGDWFGASTSDGAGGVIVGGIAGKTFDGLAPGGGGMFIARFGKSPCPADLDGNGSLDLFDFLAFTSLFNAGNQDADRDHNCDFDLFDFLAFQNEFNAGC